jgi:hypothetical protein
MKNKFTTILFSVIVLTVFFCGTMGTQGPCDSPNVGGHTGAPGETGCNGCHIGTANTGPAIIDFDLGTATYVPGQTYMGLVRVQQPGMQKFGFVCLALKHSNNTTIGDFGIINGARTRKFTESNREYVSHTPCGADSADSNTWTFNWTAPPVNEDTIIIYLGALAANHDHALTGDFGYEQQMILTPQVSSVEEIKEDLFSVYPNPFKNELKISSEKNLTGTLSILDFAGKSVINPVEVTNEKSITLNLDDYNTITSGIYFIKIETAAFTGMRKIIKL